jgi:hypothetical protein
MEAFLINAILITTGTVLGRYMVYAAYRGRYADATGIAILGCLVFYLIMSALP